MYPTLRKKYVKCFTDKVYCNSNIIWLECREIHEGSRAFVSRVALVRQIERQCAFSSAFTKLSIESNCTFFTDDGMDMFSE